MIYVLHASSARTIAAVAVALSLFTLPAGATQFPAAERDMCATTADPQVRIAACTQQLGQRGLDISATIAAYVNRAMAQEALGQFERAMEDLKAALALDSTNALALRTRAMVLQRHDRFTDAVADLTRAIGAHPDDLTLFKLRGTLYAQTGQAGRAVEDLSKVLDLAPGDLQARQERGLVLAAAGDHQRAVMDFTRVLNRDPRLRTARAARAFSLFRMKQYRLAIVDWDQLLKDDPEQLPVVYCRGAAKVLIGDETGHADMDAVRREKPEIAATESVACPVSGN